MRGRYNSAVVRVTKAGARSILAVEESDITATLRAQQMTSNTPQLSPIAALLSPRSGASSAPSVGASTPSVMTANPASMSSSQVLSPATGIGSASSTNSSILGSKSTAPSSFASLLLPGSHSVKPQQVSQTQKGSLTTHEFELDLLVIPHEQLHGALSAIIHTILFHRALSHVQPVLCTVGPEHTLAGRSRSSSTIRLPSSGSFTYFRCSDEAIARLVEERIRSFEQTANEYAMIYRVCTLAFKTEVFIKKSRMLGFLTTESKATHTWEQWRIPLCVIMSPMRELRLRRVLAARAAQTPESQQYLLLFDDTFSDDQEGEDEVDRMQGLGADSAEEVSDHEFQDSCSESEEDTAFFDSVDSVAALVSSQFASKSQVFDWSHIAQYIADACSRIEHAGLAHVPSPQTQLPPLPPGSAPVPSSGQAQQSNAAKSKLNNDTSVQGLFLSENAIPPAPRIPSSLLVLDPDRQYSKQQGLHQQYHTIGPEMPFAFTFSIETPSPADQALFDTQVTTATAKRIEELSSLVTSAGPPVPQTVVSTGSFLISGLSPHPPPPGPLVQRHQIAIPKALLEHPVNHSASSRRPSTSGLAVSSPSSTMWPFGEPPVLSPTSPSLRGMSSHTYSPAQANTSPNLTNEASVDHSAAHSASPVTIAVHATAPLQPPLPPLAPGVPAPTTTHSRSHPQGQSPAMPSSTTSSPVVLITSKNATPPPPPPPPPPQSTTAAQSMRPRSQTVPSQQSAFSSLLALIKAGPPQFGSR